MGQEEILAELKVIIKAQTESFKSELDKVKTQTNTTAKNVKSSTDGMGNALGAFKKYVAAAFSVAAIVKFGKACTQLAGDFNGLVRLTDATFGKSSKAISDFAETSASSFGLSQKQVYQYASDFGTSMRKIGLVGSEVSDMTLELTKRSADLGSIFNESTDSVFSKLSAGVNGSAGALSDLGVNMTEANLQAYAFRNGYGKLYDVMTESEKTMVRYNYILDQTATASGDFARASDTWNGQLKIFNANLENIKTNLGQGLVNALTPVLKVINEVMARLASLASMFKQFTVSMFGDASAVEATGKVSDNLSTATTNAKILKNALMGFDELNVLSTPDSFTSDAAGLSNYSSAVSEVRSGLDEIWRYIEEGDWESLGKRLMERMFDTSVFTEIIDELLSADISEYTEDVGEFSSGVFQGLGVEKGRAREIGAEVTAVLDTIWAKAKEVWDKTKPVLDKVIELIKTIFKYLTEKFAKGILVDLKTQTGFLCNFAKSQLDVILGVLEVVHGVLTGDIGEAITGLIDIIGGAIKGILTIVFSVGETIVSVVGVVVERVIGFVGQAASKVASTLADISRWMAETFGWEWAETMADAFDATAEKTAKWGEDVADAFDGVKEGISNACDTSLNFVDNLMSKAKSLVKSGADEIKTYVVSTSKTMSEMISTEIKKGLNKSFTVNSAITSIGNGKMQISLLPYANGGFPAQGSMFVAGEVPGQAEMVGNINGRTGVASGQEITGIADAVYSTGSSNNAMLQQIYEALVSKELIVSPSVSLGRVMEQSTNMYRSAVG